MDCLSRAPARWRPSSYVAVARVNRIEPDPSDPVFSYARLSDYLVFDQVVPLHSGTQYYETRLNAVTNPSHIGVALQGKSVRTITEEEFGTITLAGLATTLHEENPHRLDYGKSEAGQILLAFLKATPEEQKRRIAQMLVNRPLRDWAFRRSVVTAYKETCVVTRLRMVNGGGKAEVQAAHIRAVKHGGPDIVQNGIALSATCHWLFDRHLITSCLSMKVRSPMPCSCSCLSPTRSQRRRRELHGADSDLAQRLETAMAHTLRLGSLAELHG